MKDQPYQPPRSCQPDLDISRERYCPLRLPDLDLRIPDLFQSFWLYHAKHVLKDKVKTIFVNVYHEMPPKTVGRYVEITTPNGTAFVTKELSNRICVPKKKRRCLPAQAAARVGGRISRTALARSLPKTSDASSDTEHGNRVTRQIHSAHVRTQNA